MRPLRPGAFRPMPRAAAALAALLAAACGSDPATAPSDAFDPRAALADLAGLSGTTASALNLFGAGLSPTGASLGTVPAGAARSCAWDGGAGAFVCAPTAAGGITVRLRYTPLDAGGAALQAPTRGNTAAMRVAVTAAGTLAMTAPGDRAGAISVDQRQELTIGGLLGGPRTLDGVLTTTLQGDAAGLGRIRTVVTVAGLVLPAGDARWPSAGTVTVDAGEVGVAPSRVTVTFDGTRVADVLIDFDGFRQRCALDLAVAPSSSTSPLRCGGA